MVGVLFGSFIILLAIGVPIAFSIGLASLVPITLQGNIPLTLVISRMFGGIDSFPLMAIPFFILTGSLANACNLTDKIMDLAAFLVGRMRAGLAIATSSPRSSSEASPARPWRMPPHKERC
jgi:TRAP-type mannitol/chloroaromatic compound transport system permease large subunit